MIRTIKNYIHLCIALVANIYYGFPSRSMKVIGVTGTDGKTTTASLIYEILTASGKSTALLTTVSATINGKTYDTGFHVTTPNSFTLQKYMSLAKKAGVEYFVLETTSHGLDQNRVWGVQFIVSVITNIAPEHLDYHKTYERYVAAKAKIMSLSDTVMLNLDDKSYKYLTDSSQSTVHSSKVTTFGLGNDADINPKKYQLSPSIPGDFNMYNSLAALAVSLELGISYEDAKKAIHTYQTPVGRQEIIVKNPFTVMIDFAHTPHAFQALLSSLRKEYSGRIFHVFGSAGQRDKEKRPVMGKISSQYTDIIILTAEDPRDENVETISNDIAKGIPEKFPPRGLASSKRRTGNKSNGLYKIPDRREAIETALSLAEKGDLVIITGKGHEQSMNFGKGEEPWSDHKVVNDYLKIIHDK